MNTQYVSYSTWKSVAVANPSYPQAHVWIGGLGTEANHDTVEVYTGTGNQVWFTNPEGADYTDWDTTFKSGSSAQPTPGDAEAVFALLSTPQVLIDVGGVAVMSFKGRVGDVVPEAGDYTASDVGADPAGTAAAAVADKVTAAQAAAAAPVQSVAGKTGAVTLTASDVGADPEDTATNALAAHVAAADPHGQYQLESEKGVAGGYASLDGSGKVPLSQLPNDGDLNFVGEWDASLNLPLLVSSVGTHGDFYRVVVPGSTLLNGISTWVSGDWVVFVSGAWKRWEASTSGGSGFPEYIDDGEDDTFRSTTSENWQQAQRLTFTAPATGRYRIGWSYMWSFDGTSRDFECRVQLDDSVDLYGNEAHVQEPKDSNGWGAGGTDQRFPVSFFRNVNVTAGSHYVDIDYRSGDDDDTAAIHFSNIEIWRVS